MHFCRVQFFTCEYKMLHPSTISAIASGIFLLLVFIFSFRFLSSVQNAETTTKNPSIARSKPLTEEEKRKLERRLQKEAARAERELHERRQKEARDTARPSLYEEKLKRRENERETEQQRLEEERKSREIELSDEYSKWKTQIAVVDDFSIENDLKQRDRSIEAFISHLRKTKRSEAESIASIFQLSVEQVVSRVEELENQGIICGVFDDRARYLVLTLNEKESIKASIVGLTERKSLSEIHNIISKSVSLVSS